PTPGNKLAYLRSVASRRSTLAQPDKSRPQGRPAQRSRQRYKGSCGIAIQSFLLRSRTLCFHRFIDQSAHSLGVPVIRLHFAFIDKQPWGGFDSQRLGARLICLNTLSDFIALHVFLKPIEIESESFCIGNKQPPRVVASTSPNGLFPAQHVLHDPVAGLQ